MKRFEAYLADLNEQLLVADKIFWDDEQRNQYRNSALDNLDKCLDKCRQKSREEKECPSWYCREGSGYIGGGLALFGAYADISIVGLPSGFVAAEAALLNGIITVTICEGSENGVALSALLGMSSLCFDFAGKSVTEGSKILLRMSKLLAHADATVNLGPVIKPDWFSWLN